MPMLEQEPTTSRSRTLSGLIVVSSGLVLAALPLFMVGGLAVQIRADLGFTEAALGLAVTVGFVTGAVSAPFGGRLADRVGPRASLYVGSSMSIVALAGIGIMADTWGILVGFLALAGLAVAVTDPGLAILVDSSISRDKHGLAFGLKEASIPAATLAAGAAVPAIALTVGWRWAFLVGVVPFLVILILVPRVAPRGYVHTQRVEQSPDVSPRSAPRSAILLTALAAALGTAAASGVGVFLTESAVAMGISPGAAGILLATGSVAGIITRISTGVIADRTGREQFRLIAVMMGIGAVTIALGGTGNNLLLVIGTLGAFAGAWGWTGIYFLSLIRASPSRPGAVAGIGTAGLGVGNAAGPFLFGLIAQSSSFGTAWLTAGVAAGGAAVLMGLARSRMHPDTWGPGHD